MLRCRMTPRPPLRSRLCSSMSRQAAARRLVSQPACHWLIPQPLIPVSNLSLLRAAASAWAPH